MTLLFLTYSLVESFSANYKSSLHPDFGHHLKCINTMDPLGQHLMTISLTSHATFLEISNRCFSKSEAKLGKQLGIEIALKGDHTSYNL